MDVLIKIRVLFLLLFSIFSNSYSSLPSERDDSIVSLPTINHLELVNKVFSDFQTLEEQIALGKTKENILVIGESKVGKSTLIACLLGQPIQAITQDDGELMLSIASPLLPSITKTSTPWFDAWYKTEESRVYWDFRSILISKESDRRDYYHDGWEWVALQKIFQHISVKVMVVTPYTGGRHSHPKLYSMLSLITEYFSLDDLKEASCLVVTKLEPEINLSIHLQDISQSIVANTTLISQNGKDLLAYWVEQAEQRTISFFSPANEGKIDGSAIKTQVNHGVQNLASKQLVVLPCIENRSFLLPDSQIKAKRIYSFLNESAVRVVHDFCQDLLDFLQQGIENQSLLNLTAYWQSFTAETPTLKSRDNNDLLKFLRFVDSTRKTPQLFLKEWEEVFGAEGEAIKEILVLLEILQGFQGFKDIERSSLSQIVDINSRLIIKDMGHYFREDVRQELVRCRYLNASTPVTQTSSSSLSPLSLTSIYLLPVDRNGLYEHKESEDSVSSPPSSKASQKQGTKVASENTNKMASDNTINTASGNTFSVASPTLHVEKPLGDQPCKDCCDGLMNLLSCCFSRAKPIQQEDK